MIREATKDDISIIINMCEEMREELGLGYDESHIVNIVVKSLSLAPCFLIEKYGIIQGMAGLTTFFDAYTGQATLSEYGFYIQPRHRSYSAFSGLIDKCKKYADKVNMPLTLNFQTNVSTKFKEKLFERKGFCVTGVVGRYNG